MPITDRPVLTIKLAVLVVICGLSFWYLDTQVDDFEKKDEMLTLLAVTLIAVGIDGTIDNFEKYTLECKDK